MFTFNCPANCKYHLVLQLLTRVPCLLLFLVGLFKNWMHFQQPPSSMTEIIDFLTPHWLIAFYHVIGVVSLFLDGISIYLILFKSDKIDNFRYYLLHFQVACSFTDILLTILYQPVPLYPLMSGFAVGALVTYLGVSFDLCTTMACFLWIYQIGAMVICFVKKHQTIAGILKKFKIHGVLLIFMLLFFIFYTTTVSVIFYSLSIPKSRQLEYVQVNYPDYLEDFLTLPNFSVYEANSYFLVFAIFAVTGGILAFFIFSSILFNIFRMLSMLKLQISVANYRKHRAAIKSLIAQFATSSVCFVPPIILVFVVLAEVSHMQLIVELLLVTACFHSSLNATVLIVSYPTYRKFVMETLGFSKVKSQVTARPSTIATRLMD